MTTPERVLARLLEDGVAPEIVSRPEDPYCLRLRFPAGTPKEVREVVRRVVERHKVGVVQLLQERAGGSSDPTKVPNERTRRGREGPRAPQEDRE